MSEVKVNKVSPRSGTNVQLGDSGDTITIPSGATLDFPANSIANADLTGNGQITINGQAVALGGSINITTITRPTYNSGQSFTIPPTSNTSITIAGTNFQSVPVVEAINNSTGAITIAVTVSFSSSFFLISTNGSVCCCGCREGITSFSISPVCCAIAASTASGSS